MSSPGALICYCLLAIFSYLMLLITLQYIPVQLDVAFLLTKESVEQATAYQVVFFSHVFSSMFVLLTGFVQFSKYVQQKFPTLHRNVGKIYVLIVLLISGPSGFAMATVANGGWSAKLAFCLLALCWILFTYKAYASIRKGNIALHKAWMYRSYALTLSAVTLRFWKVIIVFAFEPRPMDVYRVIAWLGWVGNLLVAEWMIKKRIK
ncbi:MAG: DUF2306 domain-containing protein [Chitinophagaceae bacterium]